MEGPDSMGSEGRPIHQNFHRLSAYIEATYLHLHALTCTKVTYPKSGVRAMMGCVRKSTDADPEVTIMPQKFMDVHLTPPDPPLHPDVATQAQMALAIEPLLSTWLGDRQRAP